LTTLSSASLSQVSPTAGECPTVSVAGPAGIVGPGEIGWYVATVKGADIDVLELEWLVSAGKIDIREGKTKIGVLMPKDSDGVSVTATVNVKGPNECSASASETSGICMCVPSILLDEFSIRASSVGKRRLASAAIELEKNFNHLLYIIEYFPAKTSKTVVDRKLRAIRDHLARELKFDLTRVRIVTTTASNNLPLTKIYSVPPGAENPLH
jgi:hypothetical protein